MARLQRELYRERWIMEREQAMTALGLAGLASGSESDAGAPGFGERRRRSTNIGRRFGLSGPLVLKATLHRGDVNTRVSVLRMATPVSSVAPGPTHVPLPAQVTRSIGDWDAARPRTPYSPTPKPEPELRALTTTVAVAQALAEP